MSPRCFPTQTLVVSLLLITGCKDREVVAYRAPKDPAPVAVAPPPTPAALGGQLPEGHPPIGGGAAPAGPAMGALPDGTSPAVAPGNALVWTAPAHWQPKPAGAVRKGSYNVPGPGGAVADLAITAFPGDTGGLFANVNRWRAQVGLAPIAESALATTVEHLDLGALQIELVDFLGTANGQPTRLVGALVPHEGQTWFFKLTGPDALVAAERPAFRAFLATLQAR